MSKSLPIKTSREGYLETIPEIIVEVRSKNDTGPEVQEKVNSYLAAGVKLVWVIDPLSQIILAYDSMLSCTAFARGETLTTSLLPGFQAAIEQILD